MMKQELRNLMQYHQKNIKIKPLLNDKTLYRMWWFFLFQAENITLNLFSRRFWMDLRYAHALYTIWSQFKFRRTWPINTLLDSNFIFLSPLSKAHTGHVSIRWAGPDRIWCKAWRKAPKSNELSIFVIVNHTYNRKKSRIVRSALLVFLYTVYVQKKFRRIGLFYIWINWSLHSLFLVFLRH